VHLQNARACRYSFSSLYDFRLSQSLLQATPIRRQLAALLVGFCVFFATLEMGEGISYFKAFVIEGAKCSHGALLFPLFSDYFSCYFQYVTSSNIAHSRALRVMEILQVAKASFWCLALLMFLYSLHGPECRACTSERTGKPWSVLYKYSEPSMVFKMQPFMFF
jgi:hypothetical protein